MIITTKGHHLKINIIFSTLYKFVFPDKIEQILIMLLIIIMFL